MMHVGGNNVGSKQSSVPSENNLSKTRMELVEMCCSEYIPYEAVHKTSVVLDHPEVNTFKEFSL